MSKSTSFGLWCLLGAMTLVTVSSDVSAKPKRVKKAKTEQVDTKAGSKGKAAKPGVQPGVTVSGELYALSWHKKNLFEFLRPLDAAEPVWSRMFVIRDDGPGKPEQLDAVAEATKSGLEKNGRVIAAKTMPATGKGQSPINVLVGVVPPKNGKPGEYMVFAFRIHEKRVYETWWSAHYDTQASLNELDADGARDKHIADVMSAKLPDSASLLAVPESVEE